MQDFQPKAGIVPVLIVAPVAAIFERAQPALERFESVQCLSAASPFEALGVVRQVPYSLVLLTLAKSDQGNAILSFLKMVEPQMRARAVRVVVCIEIKGAEVEMYANRIKATGVAEVLIPPVPDRTVAFKLDRLLKAAPKADAAASGSDTAGKSKTGSNAAQAQGRKQAEVKLVEALKLASDCFVQQGAGQVRRVSGRWMIRLLGPGPGYGRWQEAQAASDGKAVTHAQDRQSWRWVPSEEGASLITDPGAWFFSGDRVPEFNEGGWTFVGRKLELTFAGENQVRATRFTTDAEGNLLVAKDLPDQATVVLPFLRASWESHLKQSKDGHSKEAAQGSNKGLGSDAAALKRARETGSSQDNEPEAKVRIGDPLKLASDCFLLDNRKCKRVAGRWRARLFGPGRSAGRWLETQMADAKLHRGESLWKWTPHDPKSDTLIVDEGAWIYRGLPPQLEDGIWTLFGRELELSFYKGEELVASKLVVNGPYLLMVAQDSDRARSKIDALEASHDVRVVRSKDGAEEPEDENVIAAKARAAEEAAEQAKRKSGAADEAEPQTDAGDELAGSDSLAGVAVRAQKTTTYPRDHFGVLGPEGSWIQAAELGDGSRWYALMAPVFSDPKFIARGREALEGWEGFWVFRGFYAPQTSPDGKNWTFRKTQPERVARFAELATPVQKFFLGDATLRTERAAEAAELSAKREREREGKELSAKLEREREGKELSVKLDSEREGKELSAKLDREREGKELSATQSGEREGKELSAKLEREREGKELSATQSGASESRELTDARQRETAAQARELLAQERAQRAKKPEASRSERSQEPHPDAPQAAAPVTPEAIAAQARAAPDQFKAERASAPTLSPLALAFLAAELVTQSGKKTLRQMGDRYATYVASSIGGLEVEFWLGVSDGSWRCVGVVDGLPADGRWRVPPTVSAGVSQEQQLQELALGQARVCVIVRGPTAAEVPAAYLVTALRLSRGVWIECASEAATLSPSPPGQAGNPGQAA